MARTIVDSNLKDRTARGRLKAQAQAVLARNRAEPGHRLPPAEGP